MEGSPLLCISLFPHDSPQVVHFGQEYPISNAEGLLYTKGRLTAKRRSRSVREVRENQGATPSRTEKEGY